MTNFSPVLNGGVFSNYTPNYAWGSFSPNVASDDYYSTKIAKLSEGGFVSVFAKYVNGSLEMFAQVYAANGAPIQSPVQMNQFTAGSQFVASVAALEDGGFVSVWISEDQDGSGYGSFGRRFDASGQPVGNEFQVNTFTAGAQYVPVVAGLKDGGYVVTWMSEGQDGSPYAIVARQYDAAGQPKGEEFLVSSDMQNIKSTPNALALPDGGFLLAYELYGPGIALQRYDAQGGKVGGEVTIPGSVPYRPQIFLENDHTIVITWLDGSRAQRLTLPSVNEVPSAEVATLAAARQRPSP